MISIIISSNYDLYYIISNLVSGAGLLVKISGHMTLESRYPTGYRIFCSFPDRMHVPVVFTRAPGNCADTPQGIPHAILHLNANYSRKEIKW